MTVLEVPLSPQPQTFQIALAGVRRRLTFKWCAPAAAWALDIADSSGVMLAAGLAVVCGRNLLEGLEYLGIGGTLYATTDHDPDMPPTFTNLGQQGHVYFAVPS